MNSLTSYTSKEQLECQIKGVIQPGGRALALVSTKSCTKTRTLIIIARHSV